MKCVIFNRICNVFKCRNQGFRSIGLVIPFFFTCTAFQIIFTIDGNITTKTYSKCLNGLLFVVSEIVGIAVPTLTSLILSTDFKVVFCELFAEKSQTVPTIPKLIIYIRPIISPITLKTSIRLLSRSEKFKCSLIVLTAIRIKISPTILEGSVSIATVLIIKNRHIIITAIRAIVCITVRHHNDISLLTTIFDLWHHN